jgi:DNA-binding MarR family transcriptional regulator
MPDPDLRLEDFFPYRLNRIAVGVSRRFQAVYSKQFGLTIPSWRVLATIAQFGSITAKEIGLHSDMHKTKVSRAVRDLEQRRWLTRVTKPLDRREELLSLTAAGRRNYRDLVPLMRALEQQLLTSLGADAAMVEIVLKKLEEVVLQQGRP